MNGETGQGVGDSPERDSASVSLNKCLRHAAIFFLSFSAIFVVSIVFVMGDGTAPFFTHAVLFAAQYPVKLVTGSPIANPWGGIFIWTLLVFAVEYFVTRSRAK